MSAEPLQYYYPSCQAILHVRFDEFNAKDTPKGSKIIPPVRGKGGSKAPLKASKDETGSYVLDSENATKTGDDRREFALPGIIPLTAELKRNGIRQADTLALELSWKEFPFDPRTVRSCGVDFYMGTLSEEEFRSGLQLRAGANAQGSSSISTRAIPMFSERGGKRVDNRRFTGWVDEFEESWDSEGNLTTRLSCSDNTRLLLDEQYFPDSKIATDKPIDQAVADFLAFYPSFRGLKVAFYPLDFRRIPMLSDATKANTAAVVKNLQNPKSGGDGKLKVLDYLTDVLGTLSFDVRVEFDTVIIQAPKTLYSGEFPLRPDAQFEPRDVSGRSVQVPTFIFGKNILERSITRKYAGYQPTNVQVVSYHTKDKQAVIARYPDKDDKAGRTEKILAKGGAKDQKWKVIKVKPDLDARFLKAIAQQYYENFNRRELEVKLSTYDLATFGGDNLSPDALDIRAGDRIAVETNEDPSGSTVNRIAYDMKNDAVGTLMRIGFDEDISRAYEKAYSNIAIQTQFLVREATYNWTMEEGTISIDVNACNFNEVVVDRDLPEDQKPQRPPPKAVKASGTKMQPTPSKPVVPEDGPPDLETGQSVQQ